MLLRQVVRLLLLDEGGMSCCSHIAVVHLVVIVVAPHQAQRRVHKAWVREQISVVQKESAVPPVVPPAAVAAIGRGRCGRPLSRTGTLTLTFGSSSDGSSKRDGGGGLGGVLSL